MKAGGGNAGHNGLRSLSAHLGNEYTRVRIGIGHPGSKDAVSPYVLHDFAKADAAWLEPLLDDIAAAAGHLAAGDARFLSGWRGQQAEKEPASPRAAAGPAAAWPARNPRHPAGEGREAPLRARRQPQEVARRAQVAGLIGYDSHGFQARHRRPAQRRQVHPFQRVDADGGGGGGQLSVLHDRAQRRRGRRADPRLERLAAIAASKQVIPTRLTFVDIAGLVRGASKGEGLGTSSSRTSARSMRSPTCCAASRTRTTHVEGRIDPLADAEAFETELMLADLDSCEKRRAAVEKKAKGGDKEAKFQLGLLDKALDLLRDGRPARLARVAAEEEGGWRALQLLTTKPVLYVCNVEESARPATGFRARSRRRRGEGAGCVVISAKIEAEFAGLGTEDRAAFLADLGLAEPGLNRLIREGYRLLELVTFFTVGPKEARAWTVTRHQSTPAAGVIHTDFEKGFIRAETIAYDDYVARREAGAKDAGKMRLEGKEYVVRDGDVMHFRFAT